MAGPAHMTSTASAAGARPASGGPPVRQHCLHVTPESARTAASARQSGARRCACAWPATQAQPARRMWTNVPPARASMGARVSTLWGTSPACAQSPSRDLAVRREANQCRMPASQPLARMGAPVWMQMRATCANAPRASLGPTAGRETLTTVSAVMVADAWGPTPLSASAPQASLGSSVNLKSQPLPAT